jgi:hypothetical protein
MVRRFHARTPPEPPSADIEWVQRVTHGGRAIATRRAEDLRSGKGPNLGIAPHRAKMKESRPQPAARGPPSLRTPCLPPGAPSSPPSSGFSPSLLRNDCRRPAFLDAVPWPTRGRADRPSPASCAPLGRGPSLLPRGGTDAESPDLAGDVETSVETCSLVIVCVSDCVRARSRDC